MENASTWKRCKEMTRFDKILVLGAGAIGSTFGALLSKEEDVTLVGRKAHVEAIRTRGLKLTGDIDQTFHLKALTRVAEIPPNSLILLTTKAHDSVGAVSQIEHILREGTVILVLQNGLGNEEKVMELAGDKVEVLRGLTTIAAELLEPGEIRVWKNETVIAKSRSADEISATFNRCGLKTRVAGNIISEVWSKLVLNCVVNPLTALFQVRNHEVVSDTLEWVREEIVRECLDVAKAEGTSLEMDLEAIDKKIVNWTNLSSMCQDMMKGRKTEIGFLNGKVVELGQENGVPTPVNRTLTCLARFLEENPVGVRRRD